MSTRDIIMVIFQQSLFTVLAITYYIILYFLFYSYYISSFKNGKSFRTEKNNIKLQVLKVPVSG